MSVLLLFDTYLYLWTARRSVWRKQDFRHIYSCNSFNIYSSFGFFSRLAQLRLSKTLCSKAGERTVTSVKYLKGPLSGSRVSTISTTSSRRVIVANKSMSRIKNTFDTVTKAVSSTHNELIARISRSKPNPSSVGKEGNVHISQSSAAPCDISDPKVEENSNDKFSVQSSQTNSIEDPASSSIQDSSLDSSKESTNSKNSLFHPSYFTTNFGETYNIVANHINWYFSGDSNMEKGNNNLQNTGPCDQLNNGIQKSLTSESAVVDAGSVSTKKSISNFLTNPSNSVQAFVGSYFGGLVPKLRSESKSLMEEKGKEEVLEVAENKSEQDNNKESKSAEEKAKRLSLQREKIIARVSVDNRTRALVQALRRATDRRLCISRVEELSCHLLEFPETRGVAVKEKIIPCLLRLGQAHDETLQAAVREVLALIGYNNPVKGRGIRVLTIDGGGTRGIVALQTLKKLVELTGKPVHHLFDYICGVSTGAILAFMLGLFHIPLDECEEMYTKLGSDVFKQNVIVGTMKMGWSHAYYDSEMWERMLKERMGSDLMIETARNPLCPKVSAVSTIVNRGLPLKAFIFRNYNHFPGVKSHYLGSCQYNLWQAIRASSAAPGYFQEYVLGNDLHQDGGLLINNPCALALHECKCLWPDVPFQCVISLGTGRYDSAGKGTATHTSLKTKLTNVISSATDTEEVHKTLDALLPPDIYFRFNPVMNEDIPLDENRKEKLSQLQMDGMRYLDRNEEKLKKAAKMLSQEKTTMQSISDWVKIKREMCEGLPLFSKL
ncbi:calcium-independent phospholipase A2-gamma [Rhinophrynus dorsalis]